MTLSSQVLVKAVHLSNNTSTDHKLKMRYRFDLPVLVAATTLVTVALFLFGLLGSGGHLAPPLDDTFIHLQYARQLAAGHPFQYNTGDIPSSGESSFIYPFLLAPAFLLGFNGGVPLLFAFALGFMAHLVAVIFLYKLTLLIFSRPAALLSTSLLLLDGRSNWHFMTGMETGLYTGALITFFYAWARGMTNNRYFLTAAVGLLVALLRTEGHVVVSVVCLVTLLFLWRDKKLSIGAAWLLLPVFLGLLPYALNRVLTGYWQFNTAIAKSTFSIPYIPLAQGLEIIPSHIIDLIKDSWLGLSISYSPFPLFLTIPLAILGAKYGLQSQRHGLINLVLVLGFATGMGVAMLPRNAHYDRYYQPYDTVIWLYFAAGLVWTISKIQPILNKSDTAKSNIGNSKVLYAGVIGVVVLAMLPQFIKYFFLLGDSDRHIYYQQVTFSDWIRNNTPLDARIGVNDVGAHKYWGDRYITDLVGLTDNELRSAFLGGWGSIYDVLMRRPENQRPEYLLIYPNAFINDTDSSVVQGFLTPVYSITVRNTDTTADTTEVFYNVIWEKASLSQESTYLRRQNNVSLDSVNIGDLLDEKAHNYENEGRQPTIAEPRSILTTSGYDPASPNLTESGRRHSGLESFTVKSIPGKPLVLVSRSLLNPDATQRLKVHADDKEIGLWEVHNTRTANWQEYEYTIPAQYITADHTTITIDASFDPGGPGFTSYRYWVYAP